MTLDKQGQEEEQEQIQGPGQSTTLLQQFNYGGDMS